MINYCTVCNKQIGNRYGCSGSRVGQKTCSRKCWAISIRTVKSTVCVECGKDFRPKTTTKINKFCCHKCYWLNMKKEYRGERNNAWKGGKRSQDYLDRRRFQREVQGLVFKRDNYTCQICGIRGVDLQVDHILSWKDYPDLRFDTNNCRTLCAKCHYKETFGREMPDNIKKWGHNLTR